MRLWCLRKLIDGLWKPYAVLLLSLVASGVSGARAEGCDSPRFVSAAGLISGGSVGFFRGVGTGDFNRDGLPDLAIADYATNRVSVFLARAPGLYQPVTNYEVGPTVSDVVVGDFNGDNVSDLAVVSSGNYSVLTGRLDGTFSSPIHTASATSGLLGKLAVGDFNRDGKADLAHKAEALRILLGNGDGTFSVGSNIDSSSPTGISVTVADVTGDGLQDLVTANSGANALRVFLGNGDGTFQSPASLPVPTRPFGVVVGDFNGDAKPDLVSVNNGANNITVLLGNGQGGFSISTNIATGAAPYTAVVADFDRDGRADIAVANQHGNSVSILMGAGDGSFTDVIQHEVTNPVSLAVVDFDLDGIPDLAAGTVTTPYGNSIWLLRGLGDGRFWSGPMVAPSGGGPKAVAVADFNGDTRPDLAVMNSASPAIGILINDGGGHFSMNNPITLAGNAQSVTAADFNGDGHTDVAAVASSAMFVAFGKGDGTFHSPVNVLTGGGFFLTFSRDVIAADVDANGHPDLLLAAGTMSGIGLTVFRNDGNGTFQAPVSVSGGGLADPIAVADFDGDGRLDTVLANQATNRFLIFRNNGDGTYQAPVPFTMGTNVYAITSGDFNGDGRADVAVANLGCYSCGAGAPEGSVSVRLGMGDGTFLDPTHYTVTQRPQHIASGDFNGDGIVDLVVSDLGNSQVALMTGRGDGSFDSPMIFTAPGSVERLVVDDFTGDGKVDLAGTVFTSQGIAVFVNACESRVSSTTVSLVVAGKSLVLSWPAIEGFELQSSSDLVTGEWSTPNLVPISYSNRMEVTVPLNWPQGFFRLRKQ